jgi:hypothetical protein
LAGKHFLKLAGSRHEGSLCNEKKLQAQEQIDICDSKSVVIMKAGHDDSGLVAAGFNDVLTEHAMWNCAPDSNAGGFKARSKIRQSVPAGDGSLFLN